MNEETMEDWLEAIKHGSAGGSGLGINLSNIRPQGATISSSAPSGVSGLITSFDAASMYPTMMGGSNYDINDKSYHVSSKYPFVVKRMSPMAAMSPNSEWSDSVGFARRYDAEKASLEALCQWSDGNWEQDIINKKKLETFDEDHPEWLI